MRPTLIALTATLVLGLGAAHAQPVLDLGAATALAVEAAADVRSARLDLTSAERDLARLAADPTTLRVPRLQAEHAVDRARTALAGAELAAADAAAGAYEGALEADDRLALAEGARDLAATALQAARIQFDAGAATRLDVERAENDLQSAERDVVDAQAARTLAYDRLASLLAISAEELALAPAPTPGPVAPLEAVLEGLEANAQLLAAAQQVALATAQLAAIDNPLSSARADVAAARDRVETAQLLLDEQRRNLVLFVRQAHNAALAAEARVRGAEANLATAREDVQVQQVRFDAGSISALVLARAQQQVASQEANLAIAQHALAAAVRQVELTVAGAR
jgi:cobalt-zinc-cadmium efflux system outer membrane protein